MMTGRGDTGRRPRRRLTSYEAALSHGLNLLVRQAHSTARLADKLARRGCPEPVIRKVLNELGRLGYLDDLEVAIRFLRTGAEERLLGRRRLAAELRRHGIGAGTIRTALRSHRDEIDENHILNAAVVRFLERHGPLDSAAAVRKGYHHLLRRGFEAPAIRRALEPHLGGTGIRGIGRHGVIEGE
jgi:regulatory protein